MATIRHGRVRRMDDKSLARFKRIEARRGLTEFQKHELRYRYKFRLTPKSKRRIVAKKFGIGSFEATKFMRERRKYLTEKYGKKAARSLAAKPFVESGGKVFSARVSQEKRRSTWTETAIAKKFHRYDIKKRPGIQDFYDAMQQWPDLVANRLEQLVDGVAQLAYENIKARTPVLTGAAAEGWFHSKTGQYVHFIGNNEPHIRRLEYGWSSQPNRGFMVRATVKRMRQWVNQAAIEMSK